MGKFFGVYEGRFLPECEEGDWGIGFNNGVPVVEIAERDRGHGGGPMGAKSVPLLELLHVVGKIHPDAMWPTPIPVSERLPAVGEPALWFEGGWETGTLQTPGLDGKWWWRPDNHWDICEITPEMYWMPLPPTPESPQPAPQSQTHNRNSDT